MTFKAILFDFDGVIANTLTYHVQAWQQVFDKYEVEIIPEEKCPNGCLVEFEGKERCVPLWTRLANGEAQVCTLSGLDKQKSSGEACQMNPECETNVCVNGECLDEGFLNKLFAWLKRLFA